MMTTKNRKNPLVRWILVLLILAVAGYAGYRVLQVRQADREADAVLAVMYEQIPNLGVDTGISTGVGQDPMLTLSINNIDIVGCLEIPSIDLMAPVTVAGEEKEGFVSFVSGSPVKGKLMLEGDRETTLMKLTKVQPGDVAAFTDIEGIRYSYRVTTQYNLKNWDKGYNDLMICYRTNDKTRFLLGCARAE